MLYLRLFISSSLSLLWRARVSNERAHSGGRLISTRTDGASRKPSHTEWDDGKPDYLVQSGGSIIPVEVKSGRAPAAPYDSHIFQLAAYCLLVEKTYGKRPPYGIIHYAGRDFAIDYTRQLESALLDWLAEIRRDEFAGCAALP
jgi:CRISPR-associated exonuclease Cas4